MRASIVIPVCNDPRVAQVLASLATQTQTEALLEILVIGRDDIGAVPSLPLVRFINNYPDAGAAANRNRGLAEAQGDCIIFLDSDCLPEPEWLVAMLTALKTHPVVGGSVILETEQYWATSYNVATFHEFHANLPAGPRSYFPSLTLGVNWAVCHMVGPFNTHYRRSEDLEWTIRLQRAGFELWFEPKARIRHHPSANLGLLWRKSKGSGYESAALRRRYPQVSYRTQAAALLAHPNLLRCLSPAIALAICLRIFYSPTLRPYLATFLGVGWCKLAWCFGAARQAEIKTNDLSDPFNSEQAI